MNSALLPRRVPEVFSAQHVDRETVVYDSRNSHGYCLNPMSSVVWRLCDGSRTNAQIATAATLEMQAAVTEELVQFAVEELRRDGLLESEEAVAVLVGLSRRELVKRLGIGAAVLLPIVTRLVVPPAALAYGGGCVLPGTKIRRADGTEVEASLLEAGEWLQCFDPGTGAVRPGQVSSIHRFRAEKVYTFFTESGEVLQGSPTHLVIARDGDVHGTAMTGFRAGDAVMVYEAESRQVVSRRLTGIHVSEVPQTVYGIEMRTIEHTLVTGDVVSHNLLFKIVQSDEGKVPAVTEEVPDRLAARRSPMAAPVPESDPPAMRDAFSDR